MRCACVDIGSNTTRVLVADVDGDGLREVTCEKAYTRLGSVLRRTGSLPEEALAAVADVVATQVAVARSLGAERLRVVATAAIRAASNAGALVTAVHARAGVRVEVLDGGDEARLAFRGATAGRTEAGRVAVVDVGGGSTEFAVGDREVEWSASLPIGSSTLADAHFAHDPPTAAELEAVRADARLILATVDPPRAESGIAAGGSAIAVVERRTVERAVAALIAAPSTAHGMDPERARLLPAGLLLLLAAAERVGCPLAVGRGGLREGVCLELFTTAG